MDAAALAGGSVLPVDGSTEGGPRQNAHHQHHRQRTTRVFAEADYTITYRCLIGVDRHDGRPLISRSSGGVRPA